jgi:cytochrome c biogenesis protein CcdA
LLLLVAILILPIILGVSFLQGDMFWSWITLLVFAIGYSLPLGGILVGLGFGFDKFSNTLAKNKQYISSFSGVIMILIGFGLLLGWI